MKTIALVVMSTVLMFTAVPVFAMTHQQRLACTWTAGNCLDEAKLLQKRIAEIKDEITKNRNASAEETRKLDKQLKEAMDQLASVEGNY